MHSRRVPLPAALLAVLVATMGSAAAQVERSPQTIRNCLCLEQSVNGLKEGVEQQRRVYEERREAFQALDNQLRASRAKVNVANEADVEAYKRLLEQRDAAADALAGPATTTYAEAVSRYNRAVADYNAACAGKAYDPDQLAEVKRGLACPKP